MQEFCPDLEWFLTRSAGDLGECSSFASQVQAIATSGAHSSDSSDCYPQGVLNAVARARPLQAAWRQLGLTTQLILLSRYCPERAGIPDSFRAFREFRLLAWVLADCEREARKGDEAAAIQASDDAHREWFFWLSRELRKADK